MRLNGICMNNTDLIYPVKRLSAENAGTRVANCCHLIEGETCAGLFLDNGLDWLSKPSLHGYQVESFIDYETAHEELVARYHELERQEPLNLDKLYFVESKALYTVIIYSFGAIITQDQYKLDFLVREAAKDDTLRFVQGGLEYGEAQSYLKTKFAQMTANPYLDIPFDFPVESAFIWDDITPL